MEKGNTIELFMWGYQDSFVSSARFEAERLFGTIDQKLIPHVFLVGVLMEERENRHPICLEPEDCGYEVRWFEKTLQNAHYIETLDKQSSLVYSNANVQRMHDERIKLEALRKSIQNVIDMDGTWRKLVSFCSTPVLVEGYQVSVVIQFDRDRFQSHYTLNIKEVLNGRVTVMRSFLDACIWEYLYLCVDALRQPNPGSSLLLSNREKSEIIRAAGKRFMEGISLRIDEMGHGLFDDFNNISSLKYEGSESIGRVMIAQKDNPFVDIVVELKIDIGLREYRGIRKLLELASHDLYLLSDAEIVYGLGRLRDGYNPQRENLYEVYFTKHHTWELRHNNQIMMCVSYGQPSLPKEIIDESKFKADIERIFPNISTKSTNRLWNVIMAATKQKHGTLVVISPDAGSEAERLQTQSTLIEPTELAPDIVQNVTAIDGAVLIDPDATCYAIGVILDGMATPKGDPSRGARYNSAIRYIEGSKVNGLYRSLAVIISEDGMIDLVPNLKPRIKRSSILMKLEVMRNMKEEENFKRKVFYETLGWFRGHQFYLSSEICSELNELYNELQKFLDPMSIRVIYPEFVPDENMNDSYFADE